MKDLIEILKTYDGELPVIITRQGKDHQYGIKKSEIYHRDSAYFGNDVGADEEFGDNDAFLNIGTL